MLKITLVCVGKIKEDYLKRAVADYSKRLGAYGRMKIIEVADEPATESLSGKQKEQLVEKEGRGILEKLPKNHFLIALDLKGQSFSSETFAAKLEALTLQGKSAFTFVIGGSLGLSSGIKNRAGLCLSFSKMTFPHQLMRLILLEQLYRAMRIIRNEPYHK